MTEAQAVKFVEASEYGTLEGLTLHIYKDLDRKTLFQAEPNKRRHRSTTPRPKCTLGSSQSSIWASNGIQ